MRPFTWLDYSVMIGYLVGVTLIGSLFVKDQADSKDFFLAGRDLGWFPVALSAFATDFSAISFLGTPGYIIANDAVLEVFTIVVIWALPLSYFLFVRFFYRLELLSAYEYLEKRFNLPLRTVCSLLFICMRLGWMATALYATSIALTEMASLPFWAALLIMGGLSASYSALGGMKAVIWTDVAQFFVFVLAIVVTFAVGLGAIPGGLSEVWTTANQAGHATLVRWSTSLSDLTTPAVLIGATVLVMISYGVDQVIIQRYFSARSLTEIRRSMYLQILINPLASVFLVTVGFTIFTFYTRYSDRLPAGLATDRWFPYFIVNELPSGVSGLVIAGIFAATMSSISSGVNSLTAATVVDFSRRFFTQRPPSGTAVNANTAITSPAEVDKELKISRLVTLFWGALATLLAAYVGKIGLIALINKTLSGFFGGVLIGVFLLGILVPRANGRGTFVGGVISFVSVMAIGAWTPVNVLWYAPLGCALTFIAGGILSLFFPAPPEHKLINLTLSRRSITDANQEVAETV